MDGNLGLGLMWYAAFLISVTLHEAAHAFAAWRLGDFTAYHGGQVTLDPLPHIRREPLGMVVVPIVSFLMGGWMIGWGSTPYDPYWAIGHPRRSAWMSLAGPAANMLLVILAGAVIRVALAAGLFAAPDRIAFSRLVDAPAGGWGPAAAAFVSVLFSLNLILMAFNLLPVPPLDGSALPLLVLKGSSVDRYQELIMNPQFSWIGIIVAWSVFDRVFLPVHSLAVNLLYLGITQYG